MFQFRHQLTRRLASLRAESYAAAALIVAVTFTSVSTHRIEAAEPATFEAGAAEAVLWGLMNKARIDHRLPALPRSKPLRAIARERSADMLARGYFSHTIRGGGCSDVYSLMDDARIRYSFGGENLAWNSGYSDVESPKRAHTALMNSSGHRANILNPDWTHGAVGAAGVDRVNWLGHRSNPRVYTQLFYTSSVRSYGAHLARGSNSGFRFDSNGDVAGRKKAWVSRAQTMYVSVRLYWPGRGYYLRAVSGPFSGYWVRESAKAYLPGKIGDVALAPQRAVVERGETYTGYRFNRSYSKVTSTKAVKMKRNSSVRIVRVATINGVRYYLLDGGIWDNYWMPVTQLN